MAPTPPAPDPTATREPQWRRPLRLFGSDAAADVDDEIRFHVETKARELVARGLPPEEARAEALRAFGDVVQVRRMCEQWGNTRERTGRRRDYCAGWLQDVQYALRVLRKDASFTLVALLILAVGIGATTAVFSVMQALLLRPLPVATPERLVWIDNTLQGPNRAATNGTRAATFLSWQRGNRSFEDLGAYMVFFGYLGYNLTGGNGEPERLSGVPVTSNLFSLLGVHPAIGRTFLPDDIYRADDMVTGGAPSAVILTDHFWRRRFGGDTSIVGSHITINGKPTIVAGVMPASFDFAALFAPGAQVDLFTPMLLDEAASRMGNMLAVVGRLRRGVTLASAEGELLSLTRALQRERPEWGDSYGGKLSLLHDHVGGGVRRPLLVLAGAVAFVLLLMCANVSNLLLTRTAARQKELAVRTALGAGRARLVRQLLIESVLLSTTGASLGLPLAGAAVRVITHLQDSRVPLVSQVAVDWRVLIFVVAVSISTGLLFGLLPALQTRRIDLQGTLKEAGRGSSGGRAQQRTRNLLVVSELALACLLIAGTGLLLRSFLQLMDADRGFRTEQVTTTCLDLGQPYARVEQFSAFLEEVRRHVATASGVVAVGFTDALPLDRNRIWDVGAVGDVAERGDRSGTFVSMVTPGYVEALGIPLLDGRTLTTHDIAREQRAAMLGQTLARRLWQDGRAVGRMIETSGDRYRVIGVLADVRQTALEEAPGPQLYLPVTQNPMLSLDLVLRTTSHQAGASPGPAAIIRAAVRAVDRNQPVGRFRTMDDLVSRAVSARSFLLWLLGGFAAMALVLASLGVYGVMAHGVLQRKREIGIRIALGATAGAVQWAVLRQVLALAVLGLAIGLAGAFALGGVMTSLLYEVQSNDPLTLVTVVVLLFTVASVAGYLPARRAAGVDPTVALRSE
ncbi:MAG: ADOP family duplicated permease [Vicinamibacteraceae bacterium]